MDLSAGPSDRLRKTLSFWIAKVLNYLYPPRCGVCGSLGDDPVCPRCRAGWTPVRPPYCRWCGQPFPSVPVASPLCGSCLRGRFRFDGARPSVVYERTARDAVLSLKFRGKVRLALPMAEVMAERLVRCLNGDDGLLPEAWESPDMIVPVPLHPTTRRMRRFNQSELLARIVSEKVGVPLATDLVRQVRPIKPQATLTARQRWGNVRGAFFVTNPIAVEGRVIVLIDDVMTTGATFDEIARVLKRSGAWRVYAIAFARGQT